MLLLLTEWDWVDWSFHKMQQKKERIFPRTNTLLNEIVLYLYLPVLLVSPKEWALSLSLLPFHLWYFFSLCFASFSHLLALCHSNDEIEADVTLSLSLSLPFSLSLDNMMTWFSPREATSLLLCGGGSSEDHFSSLYKLLLCEKRECSRREWERECVRVGEENSLLDCNVQNWIVCDKETTREREWIPKCQWVRCAPVKVCTQTNACTFHFLSLSLSLSPTSCSSHWNNETLRWMTRAGGDSSDQEVYFTKCVSRSPDALKYTRKQVKPLIAACIIIIFSFSHLSSRVK